MTLLLDNETRRVVRSFLCWRAWAGIGLCLIGLCSTSGAVQTVTLAGPVQTDDATLYSNAPSDNAGGGVDSYAGLTAGSGIRRLLVRFDLSSIPSSAVVSDAVLTLTVTKASSGSSDVRHDLYRLTNSWVEGTGVGGGAGGQITTGTASWSSRQYPNLPWNTPGGDFVSASTASTTISATVPFTAQWSGPGVTADAQAWINGTLPNYGWIVTGDETVSGSARRFASSEATDATTRPSLTITYNVLTRVDSWQLY